MSAAAPKDRPVSARNELRRGKQAEVEQILEILHKWGIHTVGEFARLEKEEVAARLGVDGMRWWERATGKSTRLLKLIQPPESFAESFEFEHDIETIEPLLFMLRRFLEQLATRLSAIYLVAQELTLSITFGDKKVYERCFKIPQPTNDVDLLFRMLHTHLENFTSSQPVVAVALAAKPTKPARQQFGLFETALRNPTQLFKTLARLIALVGHERVGTPVIEETHRPDSFRLESFGWSSNTGLQPVRQAGVCPCDRNDRQDACRPHSQDACRPHSQDGCVPSVALRRFRPNKSAAVLLENNKPIHLRNGQISGAISDRKGPYLASGNWWDEKNWARAEWDVELENGEVMRTHEADGSWKLDGVYD